MLEQNDLTPKQAHFEILNNCDKVNKTAGEQRRTKDTKKKKTVFLNSADWSLHFS